MVTPRGALVRSLVRRKSRWVKTVWLRLIEQRTLERAAAVHVTSEREAQELGHFGLKLAETVVIPNAIDETAAPVAASSLTPVVSAVLEGGDYILYMGRISWEKGLDRLIPAMAQINSVKLVVAGSDATGYLGTLEELVRRFNVSDRVMFIGQVDGVDKDALLAHARLLVLPSYSENFGNAALEAMQVGCPVVVTPEVGVARIVEESGAGFIVPGEPGRMAKAIEGIVHDDVLRRKMGEAGRRIVAEQYTWRIVAMQMEELYQRLLANTDRSEVPGLAP